MWSWFFTAYREVDGVYLQADYVCDSCTNEIDLSDGPRWQRLTDCTVCNEFANLFIFQTWKLSKHESQYYLLIGLYIWVNDIRQDRYYSTVKHVFKWYHKYNILYHTFSSLSSEISCFEEKLYLWWFHLALHAALVLFWLASSIFSTEIFLDEVPTFSEILLFTDSIKLKSNAS